MNLSTIEQGEELLKRATPGPWVLHDSCSWRRFSSSKAGADGDVLCPTRDRDGQPNLAMSQDNADLILFLVNHASELLQMAREVEELKKKVENLQWHYNDMQSRNPDA